ncbi:MAG: fructose-6-phosphate aldolase [Actinomycetaceae bacterium]|nr:fructose-6-phosphate aldolase [Actinomycetaceae bacterium]
MEIMFDTANISQIERMSEIYPYTGVTSNPTILKAEGKVDFYQHFRTIRDIIGPERSLHVQVIARDTEGIVTEAHKLLKNIDEGVYVKIPLNEAGLAAMTRLKRDGVRVTATAIYSVTQAILAMAADVDYLAPYYNRMQAMDIDPIGIIRELSSLIRQYDMDTKILAASFKNVHQITRALTAGSQAVTLAPNLLTEALGGAHITGAIDKFNSDWKKVYGTKELP